MSVSGDVLAPTSVAELREVIHEAERAARPLVPTGEGTHPRLANPPRPGALAVSMREFDSVVQYEPDDFTIGVGAGIALGELGRLLARNGQEIPIDVARVASSGTAGGFVACRPAGPRQGIYGPLSTYLLGVEGVRGGARPFKAGGMVVKNVAGYQVGKFLCGSLGAAGCLTRVNFKLRPLPAKRRLGLAGFEDESAAWRFAVALRDSGLEPAATFVLGGDALAVARDAGLSPPGGAHLVGWVFEGNASTVDWQEAEAAKVGATDRPAGAGYGEEEVAAFLDVVAGWAEPAPGGPENTGIVRIALLPETLASPTRWSPRVAALAGVTTGVCADVRTGLVTVRLRGDDDALVAAVESLRAIASTNEGTARLLALPPRPRARFDHWLTGDPNAELTARILHVFDPRGIFARAKAP